MRIHKISVDTRLRALDGAGNEVKGIPRKLAPGNLTHLPPATRAQGPGEQLAFITVSCIRAARQVEDWALQQGFPRNPGETTNWQHCLNLLKMLTSALACHGRWWTGRRSRTC